MSKGRRSGWIWAAGPAMLALAGVLQGCGTHYTMTPTGTPKVVSPPLVAGSTGAIELGGTGWQGYTAICPSDVRIAIGGRTVVNTDGTFDPRPRTERTAEAPLSRCTITGSYAPSFRVPDLPAGVSRQTVPAEIELLGFRQNGIYPPDDAESIRRIDVTIASSASAPTAAFSVSAYPRTGRGVTFDGSASHAAEGALARYDWDLDGDGVYETTDGGPVQRTTYATAGVRTVGLRVTDDAGRVATIAEPVDVRNPAPPSPAFTLTDGGGTFSFDASGSSDPDGDALTYTWDFGDGDGGPSLGSGIRVTHTYRFTGSYHVVLTVRDSSGQSSTASQDVDVRSTAGGATSARRKRADSLTAPFRLAGSARIVALGKVSRDAHGLHAPRVLATGALAGALPRKIARRAPHGLAALGRSRWAGRFDAHLPGPAVDALRARGRGVMLAVDARHRRTTVCLAVSGRIGSGSGRFSVLGGTGAARRLHATGALSRRARGQRVRASTGGARGLPAACRALKRVVPRR